MSVTRCGLKTNHWSGQCRAKTTNCGLRTADCGLRTADCGLRTADCGLRTADCGLRTADCGLRTVACSRLSVSEGDRKSKRAASGIGGEQDPGEKRSQALGQ